MPLPADPAVSQSLAIHWENLATKKSPLALLQYAKVPAPGQASGERLMAAWPHLVDILGRLSRGEDLVILKARQVGVSWSLALYALWVAMWRPNSLVLIVSKSQLDSDLVLAHCRFIYDRLPHHVRADLVSQNTGLMEFLQGGQILSLASTPNAGRGTTPTVVLLDEFAYHGWADHTYQAITPALDGGGQLVIVSTAAGPRGTFHKLYEAARQHLNDYQAVFLPWWSRPNRQLRGRDGSIQPNMAWFEHMKARFTGIPAELRQEFPATEAEAWIVLSGLVYGMDEDGILIFDRMHPYPMGSLAVDPCRYEDCMWHYAAVDWGGGDPTAMGLYGVTSGGRAHKFDEFHGTGPIPVQRLALWLQDHRPPTGYDAVVCGADEGQSVATLRELLMDQDHVKASKLNRKEGFQLTSYALKERRLTYNAERCPNSVEQLSSYAWKPEQDPNTKERYLTKTPADHHGDHPDCDRMFVAEWLGDESLVRDYDDIVEVLV